MKKSKLKSLIKEILNEVRTEERNIQRKKLYNEIVEEYKNKPPIDTKMLYEEVKMISKLLSS